MPGSSNHDAQGDERVSTEPQRKALDAMSEELVRKLHAMVAEQEARARDFAEHQHSLSSLPQLLPSTSQQPQVPSPHPTPRTYAGKGLSHHRPITFGPQPNTQSPNHETPPPPTQLPQSPAPNTYKQRDQQPPKEGGIGAGTIFFIILVIIVILRNCG